jgi:hypothetical protein
MPTDHVRHHLVKPSVLKAQIETLAAENSELRRQLATAHESVARARASAESAWLLLKSLRGTTR